MCGIAGFWSVEGRVCDDPEGNATRMAHAMQRRGPDDNGIWLSGDRRVVLAHRRLSILDVSSRGHQPMLSPDGRSVIVYNGEIYNFRDIRSDLEREGDRFVTGTDTEVILAAYRRHGVDCLRSFNGMFAFAIWDEEDQSLFLARDRFGVKPLLYLWQGGLFLFASEMKAIKAFDGLPPLTINNPAIRRFFYLTYLMSPDTVYNEIRHLDAGHFLVVKDGNLRFERWYDLSPRYSEKFHSEVEGVQALRGTLEKAVRDRLVSDVPLGAFLSGGVDSSIVVGLMAKNSSKRVKTFTVGYNDAPVYDESGFAREVARHFGTEHSEIRISLRDALAVIPDALDYLDQPFGDSSCIPTYLISRETRKEVTVALSGDGGDEVFAGYSKYQAEAFVPYFKMIPGAVWSNVRRLLANIPEGRQSSLHEYVRILKKFLRAANPDQVSRHCSLMFPLDEREIVQLAGEEAAGDIRRSVAALMDRIGTGNIDRALYTDVNMCLKDDMLTKVDLMGMANSLEIRNPFLDYRVVELAARMPGEWKLRGTERKHILKSAFRDFLPPLVLKRTKKGFGVPVGEWLRNELRGLFEETVSRRNVGRIGILKYENIDRMYKAHLSGKRDVTPLLWSILVFHWWANRFI
jgi:asparagine synthase (glutamine-hydrolysing)